MSQANHTPTGEDCLLVPAPLENAGFPARVPGSFGCLREQAEGVISLLFHTLPSQAIQPSSRDLYLALSGVETLLLLARQSLAPLITRIEAASPPSQAQEPIADSPQGQLNRLVSIIEQAHSVARLLMNDSQGEAFCTPPETVLLAVSSIKTLLGIAETTYCQLSANLPGFEAGGECWEG